MNLTRKVLDRGFLQLKFQFIKIVSRHYENRLDSARSTNNGRSGLDLAIAQETVTTHEGTISVESNTENTTFAVKLPQ